MEAPIPMSETTHAAGVPVQVEFKGVTYNVPPRLNFYQLAMIEDISGSLAAIDLNSLKKQIDVAAVALSMTPQAVGEIISPDISAMTSEDVTAGSKFIRDVLFACGMLASEKGGAEKNGGAAPKKSRSSNQDMSESASPG